MKNQSYAGRIKQSGTQNVKAPSQSRDANKGTVSYSGGDLRTGTKKEKNK